MNPIYTNAPEMLLTTARKSLRANASLPQEVDWKKAAPLLADLRSQVNTGSARKAERVVALKVVFIDEAGRGEGRLGELLMEHIPAPGGSGELYPAVQMAGVLTDAAWDGALTAAFYHAKACGFGTSAGTDVRWSMRVLTPGENWDMHEPQPLCPADSLTGRSAGVAFFIGLWALARQSKQSGTWPEQSIVQRIVAFAALPDFDTGTGHSLVKLGDEPTSKKDQRLGKLTPKEKAEIILLLPASSTNGKVKFEQGWKMVIPKVEYLPKALDHLVKTTRARDRRLRVALVVGLTASLLLGCGLWWQSERAIKAEQQIVQFNNHRRIALSVLEEEGRLQTSSMELRTAQELRDMAIRLVAQRENLTIVEVRAIISGYVAQVESDTSAADLEKAGASQLRQDHANAALLSRKAADHALAAARKFDSAATRATWEAQRARERAVQALALRGQALVSEKRFAEAVAALQEALKEIPRDGAQEHGWGEVQQRIGIAAMDWARNSAPEDVPARRKLAVESLSAALEVFERRGWRSHLLNTLPLLAQAHIEPEIAVSDEDLIASERYWQAAWREASTSVKVTEEQRCFIQNGLGAMYALRAKRTTNASDKQEFLKQSEGCIETALQYITREKSREHWAVIMQNLAVILGMQSQIPGISAERRTDLLTEAIKHGRDALKETSRAEMPDGWAAGQHNLGINLSRLASVTAEEGRTRVLKEAIGCFTNALEIRKINSDPFGYAASKLELANAYKELVRGADRNEESDLWHTNSIDCYRSALRVFTLETTRTLWTSAKSGLGAALAMGASVSKGEARASLLDEAIACHQVALTNYNEPSEWASGQNNLALAFFLKAREADPKERAQLLVDAVQGYEMALKVLPESASSQNRAKMHYNLAEALLHRAHSPGTNNPAQLLDEAIGAFQEALKTYRPETDPREWRECKWSLAKAQFLRANMNTAVRREAVILLTSAAEGFRAVMNKLEHPEDRAACQKDLAYALGDLAIAGSMGDRAGLLKEGIGLMELALEYFTADSKPEVHAQGIRWIAEWETERKRLEAARKP